ncbi:MAG: hypothetical protein HUU57_05000 [Bdellovibrio sp.]|nr:hypothetical protein [Bdellovibrio sp.]
MKLMLSFFISLALMMLLGSCSHSEKRGWRGIASLQNSDQTEGIWFLQGSSTTLGPYNGELELRKSSDGTFDVVRVVTYINNFFEGLKIQEVWTGKAVVHGDAITISYDIKNAGIIQRLGSHKRDVTDFNETLPVLARFTLTESGIKTQFNDSKSVAYSEWLSTKRPLEEKPLWINERKSLNAQGPAVPLAARAIIKAFKIDIGFEKDPKVAAYKNRPEYKNEKVEVIFDPTDFDFYRKNPDFIRVTNKITDTISLTEASVKRNAYAPRLQQKAAGFDKNAQDFHINEQGMVTFAGVDAQGNLASYIPDGDSALWTGMYIASQAMRYKVTQDEVALNNVRKSLRGLLTLIDITENPQEFARTLATYEGNQPLPERWHRGKGKYENIMWHEGGNNDMVKGIVHGYLWASLVLPESDVELRNELKDKAKKILSLKILTDKPQNQPAALGLAAYLTNDPQLKKRYKDIYDTVRVKVSGYNFDTSFYWRGSADWSGINLGMVGDINGIMIADLNGEAKIRDQLRERLMDSWVTYEPVHRHMLTLAAYGFAYRHSIQGSKLRAESSHARFMEALNNSVWALREIPYPRPNLDVEIDHSLKPDWVMSPTPRLFWKAAKKPEPQIDYFYQGLQSYPIFELHAFSSNMIWRDQAFAYKVKTTKGLQNPGVDYLYAYWLSRYVDLNTFE